MIKPALRKFITLYVYHPPKTPAMNTLLESEKLIFSDSVKYFLKYYVIENTLFA